MKDAEQNNRGAIHHIQLALDAAMMIRTREHNFGRDTTQIHWVVQNLQQALDSIRGNLPPSDECDTSPDTVCYTDKIRRIRTDVNELVLKASGEIAGPDVDLKE